MIVEGEGNELVMRGNVGFSRGALGQVRLNIGEGITGEAVEYLRPVSATLASELASSMSYMTNLPVRRRHPCHHAGPS